MSDSNSQSNKRKHLSTSFAHHGGELHKRSKQGLNGATTTVFTAMEVDKTNRHPNAVPVGAAIFDEPVSYLDLKAWIAEQEALPQPEPLTDIQRRAILDLKRSIVKTKHSFSIDEADWVSLLMSKSIPLFLCRLLLTNALHRIPAGPSNGRMRDRV